MGTTPEGMPIGDEGDAPDGPALVGGVGTWLSNEIFQPFTYAEINALSGADLWLGRTVYQSDTGTLRPFAGRYEWNGFAWRLPWNTSWGELDYAEHGAVQNIGGSYTDIIGLSVTVPFATNRKIWIVGSVGFVQQNTSPGNVKVAITDAANTPLTMVVDDDIDTNDSVGGHERSHRATGLTGSQTFKLRALTTAATCTLNSGDSGPVWIAAFDRGPNGVPA